MDPKKTIGKKAISALRWPFVVMAAIGSTIALWNLIFDKLRIKYPDLDSKINHLFGNHLPNYYSEFILNCIYLVCAAFPLCQLRNISS